LHSFLHTLILREIQSVRNPYPGLLEASSNDENCQIFNVRHLELLPLGTLAAESDLNLQLPVFPVHPFENQSKANDGKPSLRPPFEQSAFYFLVTQFGRWRALELRTDPFAMLSMNHYDRLVNMAAQMDELDLLGDNINYLCHLDLNNAPRNILAEVHSEKSLKITGILDWDGAIFAPRFVGCVPPMWLWAWSFEGQEDESEANQTPAGTEQQELKNIFEDAVGPDFLEFAYRREYRLARKLFLFAMDGMSSCDAHREADELLEEWAAVYEIYKRPAV